MAKAVTVATGSQTPITNAAIPALPQQRAWGFESSYLDKDALEEYLDGRKNLVYTLEESGDRIILFANRDLTEEEVRAVETFSGRVYGD